jgi:pimeloyl-ACP methyl ester carboxylesterase
MPTMRVNGVQIHYFDQGTGVPMLFIHPPMIGAVSFAYQVQELCHKFRVVGFDIRGHGNSEPGSDRLTYQTIVNDAVVLLDALAIDKAIVCGYSTGATVAMEAMLQYADTFQAGIFVSGMWEVSDFLVKREIQLGVQLARIEAMGLLAYGLALANTGYRPLQRAMYRAGRRSHPVRVVQYFAESLTYNCTSRLGDIKQPVLLAYGGKDRLFRPYGRILARNLPNATSVLIPGMTHQLPGRAPTALNRAIADFAVQAERHGILGENPKVLTES